MVSTSGDRNANLEGFVRAKHALMVSIRDVFCLGKSFDRFVGGGWITRNS